MKNKIIFPIILSAVLLAACNSESTSSPAENPTENSVTTSLETETEETSALTETSEEVTEKEAAGISGSTSSDHFDYFTFDLSKYEKDASDGYKTDGHRSIEFVTKNIICASYYESRYGKYTEALRFYDIDKNEMLAEIPMPEDSSFFAYSHEKNDENVLIKAYFMSGLGLGPDGFGEITVYNDYSYDAVTEYGSIPYPGIDYYNTGIYANDPDTNVIENLRTNATLVGVENGIAQYGSSIDENRFTFKRTVYNSDSCIGIYDYSTGNITEFPDSGNADPIGYYDGKIYACESNSATHHVENGIGTIYSFDVDTLEKKEFMTFHTPDENTEGSIDCFMAQDCGYMSVILSYSTSKETAYIVSLGSGEILAKHETDSETNDGELRELMYADGRIALSNFSTDKLLILDPKE